MKNQYEKRVAELEAKRKKNRIMHRVLACVGCLVVGMITLALMTPAITMEQQNDPAAAAAVETSLQPDVPTNETETGGPENNSVQETEPAEPSGLGSGDAQEEQTAIGQDSQAESGQQEPSVSDIEKESTQGTTANGDQDVTGVSEEEPAGDGTEIRPLTISNKIDNSETTGKDPSETQEFTFTVKLKTANGPITDIELPYATDTENGLLAVNSDGEAEIVLKHNESISIMDLPEDTTWQVIAVPCSGYLTDYIIEGGSLQDGGNTGEYTLAQAGNVAYVNSEAAYSLPETGGSGNMILIAGVLLMILGAGGLIVRRRMNYGS